MTTWRPKVLTLAVLLVLLSSGGAAAVPSSSAPAAPVVVSRMPERGEALPLDGGIGFSFDRPMDRPSAEGAFHLSPSVEGSFSWPDERTIRFQPRAPLARDATYSVLLDAAARGTDGIPVSAPYTFQFRTVGYLLVTQVAPAEGSEGIEATSRITVAFNRPVVPLLAVSDPASSALPSPLVLSPSVPGEGAWVGTSLYVFTPDVPLAGGTTYTARVPAGLTDVGGGLLAADFVWTFATERPRVTFFAPEDGADLVPVDATLRVAFNLPLDPSSAEGRFVLRPTGLFGPEVTGTVKVTDRAVEFTPTRRLEFGQTYVATLEKGVRSAGGGLGTDVPLVWEFTTVPLPRIVGTAPRDGEQDADPYTSFAVQFNAPIDPKTVMRRVVIEPAPDPKEVDTYYSEWENTFYVSFGAEPSHDYRVQIAPGIEDLYGNAIDQSLSVRFRTRALEPAAWLHVPGRVGTYSVYGPAHITAACRNTSELRLSLYRLSPDEYFRAQDDWYAFTPPWGGLVRAWSVEIEAPENELVYVPLDLVDEGGALEPGIYALDLRAQGVTYDRWNQQRHLFVASAVNLGLKVDEGQVLAWATDLSTGAPLSGLVLRAYASNGERAGTAVTGGDGVALLPRPEGPSWYGVTVVGDGPFTLASSAWEDGISRWDFGYRSESPQAWRGHLDTDRPLYRPGQTAFFRGVIRTEDDARYTLPAERLVTVTIDDAAGERVGEKTLPLDAFGVFSGEVVLPVAAAIGTYSIRATIQGATFYGSFQVAAYRPPEFEVRVTPERSEISLGEGTTASVDVRYFFGGAVAGAPTEWRILAEEYRFSPPGFEPFTFTDEDDPWLCWNCFGWTPQRRTEVVLSGSGTTGPDGRLVVEIPEGTGVPTAADATVSPAGSREFIIEATARTADGQVLSGRATVVAHRGAFYVGLLPRTSVGQAGKEMAIDLVPLDWSGNRVANQPLSFTVWRREWVNTFVEDPASGGHWTWKTEDVEVAQGDLISTDKGEGTVSFVPPSGGSYKVSVRGRDAQERLVQSSVFVWASGAEEVAWRRTNDDRITLVSDRARYAPGDVAKILIPSPFPGPSWALVTVERGTILDRRVLRLESNSSVVELPVTADHVPNVYIGVVIVQGLEAALASAPAPGRAAAGEAVGYVALTVDPLPQTLVVAIQPSAKQTAPGSTVEVEVRTTDAAGAPVPASLSLDVVDKGVLTLRPRVPQAIRAAFYGERGLGVSTSSGLAVSIDRLLLEQIQSEGYDHNALGDATTGAPAPMAAPGRGTEADGVAAEKAADEALPPGVEVRATFADTAFWEPTVVTGEDGLARVVVPLPDNLTTWIVRAVGVTTQTQVGEGTAEVVVTKPLLVRPVVPRFLVVGDRVELAALVNNTTAETLEVEVRLGEDGLSVEDETTRMVTVPAAGEAKVTWWATVDDVESADVVVSAVSGPYSDAARPRLATGPDGTLRVLRYNAPEVVGTAGEIVGEGSAAEVIALPPRYDGRDGSLTVRLDPSLAAGMQDGLDYLEHFEYECTEQTVSRFLPNVLTYRALRDLGIDDASLREKLLDLLRVGLERLYTQQHEDGGWGWWWDDRSNPHLTAYVVFALTTSREVGFEVKQDIVARGLDFLAGALVPASGLSSPWEANRQAWILYVLSRGGRGAKVERQVSDLFSERAKLAHYARAYLALALENADPKDQRIGTLVSDLWSAAILSATGAHWEEEGYDFYAMNTDTRSTAVILHALIRLDPANPLLPNVVRWLMVARRGGIWETTQETAWALISLTDWMAVTGELQGSYAYSVRLNDAVLSSGEVTPETVRQAVVVAVGLQGLAARSDLVVARGLGEGRLYYTAHLEVNLPAEEAGPLDRGIVVERRYLSRGKESNSARVGEAVDVELTIIAPHDLYYVVVEDPLPAGAEAVDTSLATTSLLEPEPELSRDEGGRHFGWWWRWYSRSEIRDEKVVLFAERLPAGTYTYRYAFRATQPGTYRVIPTTAREFYFPEVFGRAGGRLFTVGEAE